MPRYFEFRVCLKGIKPNIRREFLLTEEASFEDLHEAIQSSFGWENGHRYEFREKHGQAEVICVDSNDVSAATIFPVAKETKVVPFLTKRNSRFRYVYDFGDNWVHAVWLTRILELPETFRRRLLGGARTCPPEDCGGIGGYQNCVELASMSNVDIKKMGSAAVERKEWLGDWKPDDFKLAKVKKNFDR